MDAQFKTNFQDYYHIYEEIGRGGFSVVKRGVNIFTGKEVAIKILSRHDISQEALHRELNIMKLVNDCPQVVSYIDAFVDEEHYFIVLELIKGGDLLDTIVKWDQCNEADAVRILRSILLAISHCHEKGIIHRDMKPDNLLVSNDLSEIKLSDFGLATVLAPDERASLTVGTRSYLSPEMILKQEYNTSVDMWSIGCIAYVLLAGYHPFSDSSDDVPLYIQIVTGDWEFDEDIWTHIGDDAKDFISQLLVLEPEERMTAKQALMHPWIRASSPPSPRNSPVA